MDDGVEVDVSVEVAVVDVSVEVAVVDVTVVVAVLVLVTVVNPVEQVAGDPRGGSTLHKTLK